MTSFRRRQLARISLRKSNDSGAFVGSVYSPPSNAASMFAPYTDNMVTANNTVANTGSGKSAKTQRANRDAEFRDKLIKGGIIVVGGLMVLFVAVKIFRKG